MIAPGGTVGILGGGQLGRMLAQSAAKLGLVAHVYAPEAEACAFRAVSRATCAAYENTTQLTAFARAVDVVTVEFESVPVAALELCGDIRPVRPGPRAFAASQDRRAERRLLDALALPVSEYRIVDTAADLEAALRALPGDAFLKRATGGYDGKGQLRVQGPDDLPRARAWLGGGPAILEAAVPFRLECSVVAVRAADGAMLFYDAAHNLHEDGILRASVVPAPLSESEQAEARRIVAAIANALDYVGVIAVEMFVMPNEGGGLPRILVNEIAPRVHNSGHWTPEACITGQFENHIRAVCGWPLGETLRHSDARLVNILGTEAAAWETLARSGSLTLYGKDGSAGTRKMGHITHLAPRGDMQKVDSTPAA